MASAAVALVRLLLELPTPQPGVEGASERAKEILARDEFLPERKNLVERVLGWIGRRLGDLFRFDESSPGGASSTFSIIVGVVAIALLLYVLTKLRTGKRVRADDDDDDAELLISQTRSHAEWLDEALAHELAGEWKLALRARYRWLVTGLAEAGALQNVPGRTSGELRLQYADEHPADAAVFAAATDLFELAWYGNVPTGRDENERFVAFAQRLLQDAEAQR